MIGDDLSSALPLRVILYDLHGIMLLLLPVCSVPQISRVMYYQYGVG